ncbi:HNH endonuclease [Nonomuraea purpurea]|uniref:HNH endonuclease n=1 Tax=Nonomuraea purpurea TaxID=1849276 RepID=A0ABV8G1N1_9ACTN
MARKEARFPSSLWDDVSFNGLDRSTQWLFLTVYSQPELDPAGVLPLRVRRWTHYAADMDESRTRAALDELQKAGWLEVDEETEEVYVPTFFEWERIGGQPRRVVAALDAMANCCSARLRAFAAVDLTEQIERHEPPVPRGVRAAILLRDGSRCRACGWRPGDPVPQKNGRDLYRGLEIDHIHPKSMGGTDDPDNLQVLCTTCNTSKGASV